MTAVHAVRVVASALVSYCQKGEPMRTANLLTALLVSAAMSSVQAVESEFGNDCTMGPAAKQHVATDCSIHWVGEDGKRYCFGTEAAKTEFIKDPKGNLEKARAYVGAP